MSKLIVSTLTREATFNVMVDYDKTQSTGFYRGDDSISVRVYATGPTFTNTLIHSQEFKVQTVQELPTVRELSVFFVPEETTKLTAFCVYGSRLDDGYPDTLDPEFCTEIPVEWKVEVAIPEITMDQWAYFNTKSVTDYSSSILPVYTVPTTITGTTTSIVPFDVKFSVTKDPNIYGSNDIPLLDVTTITPNQDGTWELPLSTVIPPTTNTILKFITQNQHATLTFMYNGEVIHTQNVYYPTIYVDSAHTSMSRSVASVFDIGGFYDMQPCMVVNMEQDYALIGRYMERQTTSKYTFIEYSTNTDSVLIGPNMESNYDSYDTWRSIVKNKTYYQDGQPTDFDDYTFQIKGVLTGPNSLEIKRKYKFIYPEDNIFLELEMLPGQSGSILDNTIDSFYNKTLAINNKIVDNGIFDINDVSPTTGDTADYYVSVLSSTDRDPSISYEQQFIGSTTLGTTIFKPSDVYQVTTMNGVSYTGNGYQWSNADEIDISIGRFPVGTNNVICAMPLNRGLEFTSDLKYVISKGYANVANAPSDIYGVLVVGTPSLGTINAKVVKIYTPGKTNQLAVSTMHLMGITPTNTINQVGAEEKGEETTTAIAVASWSNLKEIVRNDDFAAGLTNSGQILLAWNTNRTMANNFINTHIIQSTSWTDITQIAGGYYGITGLKSDGTVVNASAANISVAGWSNITQIASNAILMGLKSDGTVVYEGTCRNYNNTKDLDFSDINTWTDIVQVATGQHYAVGLKSDGTVVFSGDNQGDTRDVIYWKDIISVSCGPFFVLGLTKYGTVVTAGDGSTYGETNVSTWTGIRQVYAGIQWSVGVKEDGTVVTTLTNSAVVENYPEYASVSSWTTNI